MTNNEFTMLMAKLDSLSEGQKQIQTDIGKLYGSDANIRERIAKLESNQQRFVTFKMLVMTAGGGAVGAGGLVHALGRIFGG